LCISTGNLPDLSAEHEIRYTGVIGFLLRGPKFQDLQKEYFEFYSTYLAFTSPSIWIDSPKQKQIDRSNSKRDLDGESYAMMIFHSSAGQHNMYGSSSRCVMLGTRIE
jgi:hypothetical protein